MVGVQSDSLHDVILARENEWMGAWLRRGRAKAESILADEFTITSSLGGEVFSKAQWLDGAMGPMAGESFHFDRLQVRGYGDIAVSVAWYRQKAIARQHSTWLRAAGA